MLDVFWQAERRLLRVEGPLYRPFRVQHVLAGGLTLFGLRGAGCPRRRLYVWVFLCHLPSVLAGGAYTRLFLFLSPIRSEARPQAIQFAVFNGSVNSFV
jgi:hypothetical protein